MAISNRNILSITPNPIQFIINELPYLMLCPLGLVYSGIEGNPLSSLVLGISICLLMMLIYRYAYLRRIRYHIGEEQLIFEYGIFQRKVHYMELYRIVDFYEHQSFMQQLLSLKSVTVFSMDRQTPRLEMQGIRASKEIIPIIRQGVESNKKRRGVYEITNR